MTGCTCQSKPRFERYKGTTFIYLTSKKGNTDGPHRWCGQQRRITDGEPSFKLSSLDQTGKTWHVERQSMNGVLRGFERPRKLRIRAHASLHCPLEKVGEGCPALFGEPACACPRRPRSQLHFYLYVFFMQYSFHRCPNSFRNFLYYASHLNSIPCTRWCMEA